MKSELAGVSLTQDNFKSSWEGVDWTIPKDDFASAFR